MQILVFGATGQTGQHFVRLALAGGHSVRAVARTPGKLTLVDDHLEVVQGSITEPLDLDRLLDGVDAVVAMLGDRQAQETRMINTEFVRELVPAMRRGGVRRFLYQAGGLSAVPGKRLPLVLRIVRRTIARSYDGQHRDNEAVMRYLDTEARDLQWTVHRAGIGSDGPSKGTLRRSSSWISIGTFVDCAEYSLRLLTDDRAVHTCDGSAYARGRRD
ncbi:putative NADH-flavin reductase [Curtobacterium luteum]|uniref:NADH-flavin reductase n=1 Tax=Curtobacterium luteum TaxID=33881 RepID=A0A8H9GAV6_9MICO|nr:NAD(P)H-binding protein [Curtobacterium luteum]MBM7802695.1 putative NADH-flavin reductase [Curtobacterium luteum]NUU49698.1 NAD(P)H-binding protein [Curtobacterium luteum]GGL10696.1 NmrA family transcriptional regulator [Curtobacterium luteum]